MTAVPAVIILLCFGILIWLWLGELAQRQAAEWENSTLRQRLVKAREIIPPWQWPFE